MTFSDYHGALREMRMALTNDIMAVFAKHEDRDETNFLSEICVDTPIIQDSDTDDGIYTLDSVALRNGALFLNASNSYSSKEFYSENCCIETLLSIRDLMVENESILFENIS